MDSSIVKFSIVVPVYNAEKYLERCITSLLQQDIDPSAFEIIAVNDGSKDTSEAILQRMAAAHENLRWVTTVNQGVSEARNLGCRMANGQYLLFVDSDDYVEPNSLGKIYEIIQQESPDVLVMDYTFWDEKDQAHLFSNSFRKQPLPKEAMPGKDFMQVCLPQVVWCSAYRTEFWREHQLTFLPIRHEDEEILPRIFYYAQRVLFRDVMFYYYFRNPDSFMMNYDARACYHLINAMNSVELFRKQQIKEEKLNKFFQNLIASRLLSVIVLGVRSGLSQAELVKIVREMKKNQLAPLPKGKKGLHRFLYNYWVSGFVAYYRIKKKHKK